MKKVILLVLLSLTFTLTMCSYSSNNKKNDWGNDNLIGEVKSIKQTPFEAISKFGEIEKGEIIEPDNILENGDKQIIYNQLGNKIEENYYESNNRLSVKCLYKYDNEENKIEQSYYEYSDVLSIKHLFKYDNKRNNIEENRYFGDGSLLETISYKFNYKGNKSEANHFTDDSHY